jgi:hypothetical protein
MCQLPVGPSPTSTAGELRVTGLRRAGDRLPRSPWVADQGGPSPGATSGYLASIPAASTTGDAGDADSNRSHQPPNRHAFMTIRSRPNGYPARQNARVRDRGGPLLSKDVSKLGHVAHDKPCFDRYNGLPFSSRGAERNHGDQYPVSGAPPEPILFRQVRGQPESGRWCLWPRARRVIRGPRRSIR